MELIFSLKMCGGPFQLNTSGMTRITLTELEEMAESIRILHMAFSTTIFIFGVPGAIFCSIIAYRTSRKKSAATALVVIQFSSSVLFLCLSVPIFIIKCYQPFLLTNGFCEPYSWLLSTINTVNLLSLLLVIGMRTLAMIYPHTLFKKVVLRTKCCILIVFVLSPLYCSRFFFWKWDNTCTVNLTQDKGLSWLFVSLEIILPSTLCLVFAVLMAVANKPGISKMGRYMRVKGLIQRALLVSFSILVCSLPGVVHYAINIREVYHHYLPSNQSSLVYQFQAETYVMEIFQLRHACEFISYFAINRKFRREFMALFKVDLITHRKVIAAVNLQADSGNPFELESSESLHLRKVFSRSQIVQREDTV